MNENKYLFVLDHEGGGRCVMFTLTATQTAKTQNEDSLIEVLEELEDAHNINIQNQEWILSSQELITLK